MPEKDHGCALERVRTGVLCLGGFPLSSETENQRGGFWQNMHQLSRCVFNMLMHQNELIGEYGILLWSASWLHFYLGCVWL